MATQNANPSVAALGTKILSAFSGSHNLVVGISGRGGAGKSTAMKKLATFFEEREVPVLSLSVDNFVSPSQQRNRNTNGAEARYYDTYDFNTLFGTLISHLQSQMCFHDVVLQLDRRADKQVQVPIDFNGPGIVIVEGVQLFRRAHSENIDFKIWIELSFEEGLRRAIARSNHLSGRKSPDQIEEMYRNRSTPGHNIHVELDDPTAQSDVILNGLLPFD